MARVPGETDNPSLPTAGRSVFDFLVAAEHGRVPFPFGALLHRIGERVEGGTRSGIRTVLIPRGRSLQRRAAAGAYFRYPRAVAAVVGEPAAAGGGAGIQLKDRLYLAYQEKAGVLEIISYNEAGGRFEFQVVEDYREGGRSRLRYANRRLCLSCHQNRAPIFSLPPWDETNANARVRRELHARKRDYYGIAVDVGADAPSAIDNATNRANRFEFVQRLWREGCALPSRPVASVRCRAEAFAAALKYRLSGDRQIDRRERGYREDFTPVLTEAWRSRWPAGLAIPSPDLPNRDPRAPIVSELDPLVARAPIDLRFGARREDIELFVKTLAEFVAERDILELDRWLSAAHARAGRRTRALRVPCRLVGRARGPRSAQIEFACRAPAGVVPDLAVAGRMETRDARLLSGAFDRFSRSRTIVRDIAVVPARIARGAGGSAVDLVPTPSALRLRPVDGRSVALVTLRWRGPSLSAAGSGAGEADIWLRDDFAPVAEAIARMAQDTIEGRSDVFSRRPFRRAAVLRTLFARLGMPARRWCCLDATGMPAAAALSSPPLGAVPAELAPFYRACAGCHEGRRSFPPGFLHGGPAQVRRNIDVCAERMLYRLGMWRLPAEARPRSPMPPDVSHFGMSPGLGAMTRYLVTRIRVAGGSLDGVLATRYEKLRRCAPR